MDDGFIWIYMDLYGFMDLYQHKYWDLYIPYEILGIYVD